MPTDWDQPGFVWSHGGAYANYIKATILYKGVISDIQVKIPLMGTYKESVILNGVTFNIRTGPNKCSITVDKSNVRAGEVQFAFGIGSK